MHLISTPLAHASDEFTPKAWAKFDDVAALKAPGVRHLHGSVVSVDCEKKTAKISNKAGNEQIEESYDYLIVGSGLKRAWPVVAQSLDKNSYLAEVGNHIKGLKDARQGVVVVGGGMCIVLCVRKSFVIPDTEPYRGRGNRDGRRAEADIPVPEGHADPLAGQASLVRATA